MRFDTPVYFQTITQGEYDQSTGNYGADVISEEMRHASVTDTGRETLQLIYGELKQGVRTVRLQTHYDMHFDRIRIGNRIYRADMNRHLRSKQTLVVSEAQ